MIKQIGAMINNRYLFQRYLRQSTTALDRHQQLFNKQYFLRWEAVKNGLYKASIVKSKESVVDAVCCLFSNLMGEEIAMARKIIDMDT